MMVSTSNGTDAAAASCILGGYWNRLQILVVMVWKPAGIARMAGEPNRVMACRKATSAPASRAGLASGMGGRPEQGHGRWEGDRRARKQGRHGERDGDPARCRPGVAAENRRRVLE